MQTRGENVSHAHHIVLVGKVSIQACACSLTGKQLCFLVADKANVQEPIRTVKDHSL